MMTDPIKHARNLRLECVRLASMTRWESAYENADQLLEDAAAFFRWIVKTPQLEEKPVAEVELLSCSATKAFVFSEESTYEVEEQEKRPEVSEGYRKALGLD